MHIINYAPHIITVELGPWREVTDVSVGSNTDHAIPKPQDLQAEMEIRYAMLEVRRNDSADTPTFAAIDTIASHRDP